MSSRQKIFISQYGKTSLGKTSVVEKKSGTKKKLMHMKGRPIFSIENSLSHSVEEMSRDPFVVSPTFWFRKKFG